MPNDLTTTEIPPGQQLVARDKWPIIGEREPLQSMEPWALSLAGLVDRELVFSLNQLAELKRTSLKIDIHCVTRWSRQGVEFSGVLLSDLFELTGVSDAARFVSFQARSARDHSTSLSLETAIALQTLIATHVNGQPLESEHGGPIRNIVPGRYFYKSVKWLRQIELLAEDRLGYWEAETGYHNNADPWREERYMAPTIDRRTAIRLIQSRDFSGRDLRSINASDRELSELNAERALLRDANFRNSDLREANFAHANLSNAHLEYSDLRGARLTGTDLEGANLCGADLRKARLQRCSLIGCSFFDESDSDSGALIDSSTVVEQCDLRPLVPAQAMYLTSKATIEQ